MPPSYGQPVGYGQPQPTTTSAAAIISLISGILGCFVITGLIAVITGIFGIKATSNPNVKGRGLAITGIILGLVFSLISIGIGGTMFWGMGKFKELAGEAARPFLASIVDGNLSEAAANTTMSPTELGSLRDEMKDWGKVTGVSMSWNGINARQTNGRNTIEMRGTATFEKAGAKQFSISLDDGGAGKFKVVDIKFDLTPPVGPGWRPVD